MSNAQRVVRLTAAALAALVPVVSMAARPVDPPSVELTRGENNVVAATVVARPDATHIVVRIEDVLAGEAEGELVLRSDADPLARVEVDTRYLIAFTRLANDDQFRDAKFLDPEGPRILTLRGLRDIAVIEDTLAARFLFERARGEDQPSDGARLEAIMALVYAGDQRTRGFALEELYLRSELPSAMSEFTTRALAEMALDASLPLQLRQFIVETTLAVPARDQQPWLLAMDRKLLADAPPQMDLVTAQPLLVSTAIKAVAAHGSADDVPLLLPLVESNAPGVAKRALETAGALDPAATRARVEELVQEWLLRDDIHTDVRRAVERYFIESQLQAIADKNSAS
jgi:hypothetical protein